MNTWDEVVTMAESLELGLNKAKKEQARKNVMTHKKNERTPLKNQCANGRQTDSNLERNKFNSLHEINRITHRNLHKKWAMKSLESCLGC